MSKRKKSPQSTIKTSVACTSSTMLSFIPSQHRIKIEKAGWDSMKPKAYLKDNPTHISCLMLQSVAQDRLISTEETWGLPSRKLLIRSKSSPSCIVTRLRFWVCHQGVRSWQRELSVISSRSWQKLICWLLGIFVQENCFIRGKFNLM